MMDSSSGAHRSAISTAEPVVMMKRHDERHLNFVVPFVLLFWISFCFSEIQLSAWLRRARPLVCVHLAPFSQACVDQTVTVCVLRGYAECQMRVEQTAELETRPVQLQ